KLASSGHAVTLAAGSVALSAATSFDTGSGMLTVAPASGTAVSLGTAGSGLDLSDADLGRLLAGGLTVRTSGAADIAVDGVTAHGGFGALTLDSGRAVSFGTTGSHFAHDVTAKAGGAVSGVGIAVNGNVDVGANTLTLAASAGQVNEAAGAVITAGTLKGSAVGGASLAGSNAVGTLGAFANTGSGDLSFTDGQSLTVDGTSGAVSSAGNITLTTTAAG